MRKLIESTFITLNGVIDEPQNWSPPYWDDEHAAYSQGLMDGVEAQVLGRVTYEGFADAWSQRGGDPFTDQGVPQRGLPGAGRATHHGEQRGIDLDQPRQHVVVELVEQRGPLGPGLGDALDTNVREHRPCQVGATPARNDSADLARLKRDLKKLGLTETQMDAAMKTAATAVSPQQIT